MFLGREFHLAARGEAMCTRVTFFSYHFQYALGGITVRNLLYIPLIMIADSHVATPCFPHLYADGSFETLRCEMMYINDVFSDICKTATMYRISSKPWSEMQFEMCLGTVLSDSL